MDVVDHDADILVPSSDSTHQSVDQRTDGNGATPYEEDDGESNEEDNGVGSSMNRLHIAEEEEKESRNAMYAEETNAAVDSILENMIRKILKLMDKG